MPHNRRGLWAARDTPEEARSFRERVRCKGWARVLKGWLRARRSLAEAALTEAGQADPKSGGASALRSGNALVRDHQDEALRLADAGPARPTRPSTSARADLRPSVGAADVAILNFSRRIHDDLGSLSIRGERR